MGKVMPLNGQSDMKQTEAQTGHRAERSGWCSRVTSKLKLKWPLMEFISLKTLVIKHEAGSTACISDLEKAATFAVVSQPRWRGHTVASCPATASPTRWLQNSDHGGSGSAGVAPS